MRKKVTTIIEITQSHIKVLEGAISRSRPNARRYDTEKIVDVTSQGIAKTLSRMMDKRSRRNYTIAVAPRRQVMLRVFSLPSTKEEELKKMIFLQIVRQVPYQKDDIVFDFIVIGKDASGYTKVLTAVVRKESINQYFKIFLQAGVTINAIALSSMSIANWVFYAQRKKPFSSVFAVLHVDSVNSEICFCEKDKLLFSRFINFGTRDLAVSQQDNLIREIEMTFQTFQKENTGQNPEAMFILAPEDLARDFSGKIQEALKIQTSIVDPIQISSGLKKQSGVPLSEEPPCSPVVALGTTLKGVQRSFNLLPVEVSEKRSYREKKNVVAQFFVLFILCLSLLTGIFFMRLERQKQAFFALEKRSLTFEPRLIDLEKKKERIKTIKNYLNIGPLAIDVLNELYRLTPEDIFFRLVQINQQQQITMQGVADQLSNVNAFQNQLVNSSMFKEVNLQYATQRRAFEGEITDFTITARIIQP
jgi:Tfp pilus assembly PilM family ATPase/Tfp pilus assembly protein PilN